MTKEKEITEVATLLFKHFPDAEEASIVLCGILAGIYENNQDALEFFQKLIDQDENDNIQSH